MINPQYYPSVRYDLPIAFWHLTTATGCTFGIDLLFCSAVKSGIEFSSSDQLCPSVAVRYWPISPDMSAQLHVSVFAVCLHDHSAYSYRLSLVNICKLTRESHKRIMGLCPVIASLIGSSLRYVVVSSVRAR